MLVSGNLFFWKTPASVLITHKSVSCSLRPGVQVSQALLSFLFCIEVPSAELPGPQRTAQRKTSPLGGRSSSLDVSWAIRVKADCTGSSYNKTGGCQIRLSSHFLFFPLSGLSGYFRNFSKESGEKEVGSHWPFLPSGAHISQLLGPPGGLITGFAGGKRYCAKKRGLALTRPPRFSHNGPQGLLEPYFVIKSSLGTQFRKQSRRQSFLNCRENPPVRIMAYFGHIFFWRCTASSHPQSDVWLSNIRWENCQDKAEQS